LLVFYNYTVKASPDANFEGFVIENDKLVGLPFILVVVDIDTDRAVSSTVFTSCTSVEPDYYIEDPSLAYTFSKG
jgi:hypothetical protein